jgi:hypothetical protein
MAPHGRNEKQWNKAMQNTFMYAYREKGFDTNWSYRHWLRLIEYSGARFLFFSPHFAAACFGRFEKQPADKKKILWAIVLCHRYLVVFKFQASPSLSAKVCSSVVWREKEFRGRQVRTGQRFPSGSPFFSCFDCKRIFTTRRSNPVSK